VVVWLDLPPSVVGGFLDVMRWGVLVPFKLWMQWWENSTRPGPYDGLQALHRHKYWSRVWILQEFLLAKQLVILCGDRHFTPQQLEKGSKRLHAASNKGSTDPYRMPSQLTSLLEMRRKYEKHLSKGGLKVPLLDLLDSFKYAQSTDPRDQLYALRGLAADWDDMPLDYGLTVNELLHKAMNEVVRRCINRWNTNNRHLDVHEIKHELKVLRLKLGVSEDQEAYTDAEVDAWQDLLKCYQPCMEVYVNVGSNHPRLAFSGNECFGGGLFPRCKDCRNEC
jgi:hypothetical protein